MTSSRSDYVRGVSPSILFVSIINMPTWLSFRALQGPFYRLDLNMPALVLRE